MPTPAITNMTSTKRKHSKPERTKETWLRIVTQICDGNPKTLREIYALARKHAKAQGRRNVEAKVRQVLYTHPAIFFEFSPGVWSLVEFYTPDEVNACRLSRTNRLEERRNRAR